jgi:uncharacterized protein
MQTGSTARDDLKSYVLEPSWVLEGNLTTRALLLAEAPDGDLSCGLWDCTAGKFNYTFFCDEIVHILEGEVIIEQDGNTVTLRPGDVAFFPKGATTVWTVPHYLKKLAIHRSVNLSLMGRVRAKWKRMLNK